VGLDIAGYRNALVGSEDFTQQFSDAKQLVGSMPVQFVIGKHPDLRTVFEVYATYALGTRSSTPCGRTERRRAFVTSCVIPAGR
jgi:hypothetical protein